MNGWIRVCTWVYMGSLHLYPDDHREQFAAEMAFVFEMGLKASIQAGGLPGLGFLAREILDMPGSLYRAHRYSWRRAMNDVSLTPDDETMDGKGKWAALLVFVLPVLILLFSRSADWLPDLLVLVLVWALVLYTVGLLVMGIRQGFPRWTMPYLGLILGPVVTLGLLTPLWEQVYPLVYRLMGGKPDTLASRIAYQGMISGTNWLLFAIVIGILFLLARNWSQTRSLAARIQADWTLYSLVLYSGLIPIVVLTFEFYAGETLYQAAAWLFLAGGAWFYVKNATKQGRILALLAGTTGAFMAVMVGKWVLLPSQAFDAFLGFNVPAYRAFEVGSLLIEWLWVMLFLLLPGLVQRVFRREESDVQQPVPAGG